jgi:hypothetical protein
LLTLSLEAGILPYKKSKFSEWVLPGHGEPYVGCGTILSKGCLNIAEHPKSLDLNESPIFVMRYKLSCHRKECPECYESWAGLEAGRGEYRINAYSKRFCCEPIHVIVSPSNFDMNFSKMRSKCYSICRSSGIHGGACVFHPFRKDKMSNKWYFSPHFHVIGFGWIRNTDVLYRNTGWLVKNKGIRKTVFGTFLYQLSHAGINPKFHVVTWFGKLAYNNFIIPKKPDEPEPVCPICGKKLIPLIFIGETDRPPPEKEGNYYLKAEGWIRCDRHF